MTGETSESLVNLKQWRQPLLISLIDLAVRKSAEMLNSCLSGRLWIWGSLFVGSQSNNQFVKKCSRPSRVPEMCLSGSCNKIRSDSLNNRYETTLAPSLPYSAKRHFQREARVALVSRETECFNKSQDESGFRSINSWVLKGILWNSTQKWWCWFPGCSFCEATVHHHAAS